jgi:hypothetical protein
MINIISSILHAFVLIYIQTQSAYIYPHSCSAKPTGQRQAWSRVAAVLWRKHADVVCLYDFICATVAMFIQFMLCNCSHSYLPLCASLSLSTFYITPFLTASPPPTNAISRFPTNAISRFPTNAISRFPTNAISRFPIRREPLHPQPLLHFSHTNHQAFATQVRAMAVVTVLLMTMMIMTMMTCVVPIFVSD